MYKSVLITRESQAAMQTANKLLAKGYAIVLAPLISVENCKVDKRDICKADYMLVTSFNAAKRVQDMSKDLSRVNAIVVGEKSAQYLKALGVNVIHVAEDAQALLGNVSQVTKHGSSIDFVCGDHIASRLDKKLVTAGFKLNKIEVYKSIPVDSFDLGSLNMVDVVLLYSPRTAQIFADFVRNDMENFSRIECVCISRNVADLVMGLGFKNVRVSANPTDDSVIECLEA